MARSTARAAAAKREQILNAATLRFAQQSYEDASFRAIAADVGIDVAHVHRSFGSKEQLLIAIIRAASPPTERLLSGPAHLLPVKLADALLAYDAPRTSDDVGALDIFVRSLTSREASGVLRDSISADFIAPLSLKIGPGAERRAALVLAVLLGVRVLREVLHIAPLLETRDGEIKDLLAHMLLILMGASCFSAADAQDDQFDRPKT